MRLSRVLVVAAVALTSAITLAPEAHAATAPVAPFDAFTVDGAGTSGLLPAGQSVVLDSSNATFTATTNGATAIFLEADGVTPGITWRAEMAPPTGGQFVVGQTYQTARTGDATHAALDMIRGSSGCNLAPGTLTVKELVQDPDTQAITALAATYSFDCEGRGTPITGELRYQSSLDYVAGTGSPAGLDFGTVDIGQPVAPQTVTFTSSGSAPLVLGAASVSNSNAFSISADTCSRQSLAFGATCTVSVVAHPATTIAQSGNLVIPDNTAATQRLVPLAVAGKVGAAGNFFPVSPTRILDTRNGTGAPKAALGSGGVLHLQVTGRAGVPTSGVGAVVMNVTVTGPTAGSYLTAYPTGTTRPLASNLNFPKSWTGANAVTVPVGTGGKVDIYNNFGSVQVIADVVGFYVNNDDNIPALGLGGQFFPADPFRLLDSRIDFPTPIPPHGGAIVWLNLDVDNPHIRAFAVNITAVAPTNSGYLTAWNGLDNPPLASTLNYVKGATVANMAIVPAAPCGIIPECSGMPSIAVYNGSPGSTHILIDVFGIYDDSGSSLTGGLRFHPLNPTRIADTRTGQGAGTLSANTTAAVTAPSTVAGANTVGLGLNVTAVKPTANTYLTLWAAGGTRPVVSNLDPATGQTVANTAFSLLSPQNAFDIYNWHGSINVAVDVAGTFEVGVDPSTTGAASKQASPAEARQQRRLSGPAGSALLYNLQPGG
ncbi:MAG: choice-of-anchor D domain-containing protein [Micromonosporaceae bacterium]|nr:choice-of-anchor D domain-containing protein [Micromonosporaceae bacterium]